MKHRRPLPKGNSIEDCGPHLAAYGHKRVFKLARLSHWGISPRRWAKRTAKKAKKQNKAAQ